MNIVAVQVLALAFSLSLTVAPVPTGEFNFIVYLQAITYTTAAINNLIQIREHLNKRK